MSLANLNVTGSGPLGRSGVNPTWDLAGPWFRARDRACLEVLIVALLATVLYLLLGF